MLSQLDKLNAHHCLLGDDVGASAAPLNERHPCRNYFAVFARLVRSTIDIAHFGALVTRGKCLPLAQIVDGVIRNDHLRFSSAKRHNVEVIASAAMLNRRSMTMPRVT